MRTAYDLSAKDRDEIVQYMRTKNNISAHDISVAFNVECDIIHRLAKKHGITLERKTSKIKPSTQRYIEFLKQNTHLTKTEAAKELQLNYNQVEHVCRNYGIEMEIECKGRIPKSDRRGKDILADKNGNVSIPPGFNLLTGWMN